MCVKPIKIHSQQLVSLMTSLVTQTKVKMQDNGAYKVCLNIIDNSVMKLKKSNELRQAKVETILH